MSMLQNRCAYKTSTSGRPCYQIYVLRKGLPQNVHATKQVRKNKVYPRNVHFLNLAHLKLVDFSFFLQLSRHLNEKGPTNLLVWGGGGGVCGSFSGVRVSNQQAVKWAI